jgi:hypothetical protein
MERKKSQILFNFLPGSTFDHSDNGVIGRTISVTEDESAIVDELPKHHILGRIRPEAEQWHRPPSYRSSDVRLVAPDDVEFEIFPRDFECARCRVVTQIDAENLRRDDFTPACESCGKWFGDTEQLQLVAICNCGKLESLEVPSHCRNRGVKLIRGSSLIDARWVCECGEILESPYDAHGRCDTCGTLDITPHSASQTFYPQRAEFVNAHSDDIDNIRNSQHFRLNVVGNHLAETVAGTRSNDDGPDDLTQAALEQLDPEIRDRVVQARNKTVEDHREQIQNKRDWLNDSFDEEALRGVAEEVFEYESLLSDGIYSETLQDLADDARSRRDLDAPTIERYTERAADLNFGSIRLIENFPITTAVYGYTRVSPEPEENVRLRPLRSADRDRDRDEVYVRTSETEAIAVELDPKTVVEWLDQNLDNFNPPEENHRDWLVDTMTLPEEPSVYPYFDEIAREPEARYPLVLLHTLSHLFINTVDALSGYEADSLVEYTLPRALTFVVYKRSQTDFSLGSMFTMVENRFDQICDYLEDEGHQCMYDPLCEHEENSACEGCLYVSSRSCKHGNHNLARSTVYGGAFDDNEIDVGYFNA